MSSGPGEAGFVCGLPGAGKSTLGRTLAGGIAATLLDRDTLIGPLGSIVHGLLDLEPADLDSDRSRAALGGAPYRTLFDAARDNVAIGGRVALVAPFTRWLTDPELLARLPELVGTTTIRVVDAWCPASVRVARLRKRAAERDAHRLVTMACQDSAHPPEESWSPAVPHIRVHSTRPLHEQFARARRAPTIG